MLVKPKYRLYFPRSTDTQEDTTSPTISVERVDQNNYFGYLQPKRSKPNTMAELTEEVYYATDSPIIDSRHYEYDENGEDVSSALKEDDVEVTEQATRPTIIPIIVDVGEPEAAKDENANAAAAPPAAESPAAGSDGANGGSSLPSDSAQTPPPAEAVPGQPGEADPDSSGSSSGSSSDNDSSSSDSDETSSSSSSSSEEVYSKQLPHNKKEWQYTKLKSGKVPSGKILFTKKSRE